MKHYSIAAVLPHLQVFGGIRRYLMLGDLWARWGHGVVLYTPEGRPPAWLPFPGRVACIGETPPASHDVAFTPQPALLGPLRALPAARRVFYCVLEDEPGERDALDDPALLLMANSGALRTKLERRARRPVLDGIGGIDPARFHPVDGARDPRGRVVLAYGRRSRARKGTDLVVRAVESVARRVPGIELVLFDHVGPGNEQDPREGFATRVPHRFVLSPSQAELAALYASANVFVSAEKRAGWGNTAIEAMASGAAVLCTPSGTRDFARHGETAWLVRIRHPFFLARGLERLLTDAPLRARLGAAGPPAVRPFAWNVLAAKILDQLGMGDGVPDEARRPGPVA